jgi:uncharacterized protein YraI
MVEYATVVGGSLNMRTEKDKASVRITIIPSGTKVAIIEYDDDWCKIAYNAYTGYVMTQYLKFESGSDDSIVTITLSRENALALYEALKLSLNQ